MSVTAIHFHILDEYGITLLFIISNSSISAEILVILQLVFNATIVPGCDV